MNREPAYPLATTTWDDAEYAALQDVIAGRVDAILTPRLTPPPVYRDGPEWTTMASCLR